MEENYFNQIKIEKAKNGYILFKQQKLEHIFGNSTKNFEPHIAKDYSEIIELIKNLVNDSEFMTRDDLQKLKNQKKESEDD